MKNNKNIFIGLAIFICTIAVLLLIAAPVQVNFGLLGLGITEILILAIALVGCLVLKNGWKETFPFKWPRFADLRGGAYTYIGVYGLNAGLSVILLYIFPGMGEVSDELLKFFSGGGYLLFITVSLLPGICEEALFRGTILSSFRHLKSTAAIVVIVGVLFGLFHLNIYRFLPTMILGMGFTYIMIKTGNLLYVMLFHALNNLFGILPTLLNGTADAVQIAEINVLALAGTAIAFFAIGTLFLRLGVRRLNGKNAGGEGKAKRILFNIAMIIIMLIGFAIVGIGAGQTVNIQMVNI